MESKHLNLVFYKYILIISISFLSACGGNSGSPSAPRIDSITFADTNLQDCVTTAAVGKTYIYQLTTLSCTGKNISDLSGLEKLVSLQTLYLNFNNISDISALSSLRDLTTLSIYNNSINDLSALSGLSKLANLTAYNNSISDVSPLSGLTELTVLYLGANNISDISPLTNLTKLYYLDLGSNVVSDITSLSTLINITTLSLSGNSIVDVSPLATMTKMNDLYLYNNNIGGQGVGKVDSLKTLTAVKKIGLQNNIGMSCAELTTLITATGSPPVNVDTTPNYDNSDVATNGTNCTNT